MKEEDLFSIPDAVTLKEAREDEKFNFLFSKIKSKKPKFDLNKYICFHKELRFGVYKHENKFYLAKIKKSIHVGKYVKPHITKIGELTKHGENWNRLKASLSGATFLNKGSESEQLFLQSILEKQRVLDEQQIAEEKKAEVRQRELDEQIAEEKKAEVRQRELDEQIAEEKKGGKGSTQEEVLAPSMASIYAEKLKADLFQGAKAVERRKKDYERWKKDDERWKKDEERRKKEDSRVISEGMSLKNTFYCAVVIYASVKVIQLCIGPGMSWWHWVIAVFAALLIMVVVVEWLNVVFYKEGEDPAGETFLLLFLVGTGWLFTILFFFLIS